MSENKQFEKVVNRLLRTPHKPHTDSKVGKSKPGGAKAGSKTAKMPKSAIKRSAPLVHSTTQSDAIGYSDATSAIPKSFRDAARDNSQSLATITSESPG